MRLFGSDSQVAQSVTEARQVIQSVVVMEIASLEANALLQDLLINASFLILNQLMENLNLIKVKQKT